MYAREQENDAKGYPGGINAYMVLIVMTTALATVLGNRVKKGCKYGLGTLVLAN